MLLLQSRPLVASSYHSGFKLQTMARRQQTAEYTGEKVDGGHVVERNNSWYSNQTKCKGFPQDDESDGEK